nr:immunoglobulin light chain junction region [Macaca mulatta]MOW09079.1 immunoglobulin light chain junction region [Macaca mulatta]MOW09112.1 immunoglobulin light chain junction region [Macaca mulatta]MOW09341.1 immunoglobulin light chain junction region [Macaca mulatta]MOW10634.1 immunoglobulin light chain junction region [Macaca mulatta]
CQHSYGIPYSF